MWEENICDDKKYFVRAPRRALQVAFDLDKKSKKEE